MGTSILGTSSTLLGQLVLGSTASAVLCSIDSASLASRAEVYTSAPVPPAPTATATHEVTHPLAAASSASPLGFGLLAPLRRDQKGDFASGGVEADVRSNVAEILGTRCQSETTDGELPWRPEFGSLLYLLKFRPNDDLESQIARVYVADALTRWETRVRLTGVTTSREYATGQGGGPDALRVRMVYDIVANTQVGNTVLVKDVMQDVRV